MSAVIFFCFSYTRYSYHHHHHTIVPTPFQWLIVSNNRNRTINFVFFYVIRFSFISIACSTNENNGVFCDCLFFISVWFSVCAGSLGQSSYYILLFDKQIQMKISTRHQCRADENTELKMKNCRSQMISWKRCVSVMRIDAQTIFVCFACSSLQTWHYLWLNFASPHELLSVRLSMNWLASEAVSLI